MKTVLILSGGGALGAFEVGALKFLLDPSTNIRPDIIIGTSVGSLNGAILAERPDIYGVGELEQVWRGIRGIEDIFAESPELLDLKNADPSLARVLDVGLIGAGIGAAIGGPFGGLVLGIFGFLSGIVYSGTGELTLPFNRLIALFKGKSLYITDPFRDNLLTPRLENRYSEWLTNVHNAGIKFRTVLISMELGDLVYVSESGRLTGWGERITELGEIVHVSRSPLENISLSKAVLASASEPVIHNPVTFEEVRDEHFYDGGVREIAPTRALFDPEAELNLDPSEEVRVFVVCASLFGVKHWPSEGETFDTVGILWPMLGANNITSRTFDLVFNETLLNDVKYAQQMAPESWKVTTIGATYFVHDSNEFIPDLLAINMGHGYTRACDVLRKAAPPYTDLTGLLVRLDLELYERVKPLSGNLRVRDLIDEAYKYWKDRDAWLRDRRWMIIPEEHVTFALQKVAEVSAVIGARRRANLPATSLAWECIGSFEYDWPEGQPQLLNPQILVSPSSLDFGEVLICCDRTETEAITIQNTGPGWLIITSIQTDSERFSNPKLDFAIIKPGDTLNLNISFSPTPEGSAQGMLSISSDDPASPTHVQLSGVGIHKPPTIRVEPLSLVLDFGRVLQDTEYTKAFTLRNLGSESLIIYSATIENPTPPDGVFRIEEFSQEIECLERGQLRVNCKVFDELTHSATIKVRYGDTGSNRSELSLTVEAIGSPVECGELASQLTNLEEDLATATGQERARVLQQIAVVKAQMRQLGCGPN